MGLSLECACYALTRIFSTGRAALPKRIGRGTKAKLPGEEEGKIAMRRLLLLRHAKAEPAGNARDFDRALAPRGRADARAMGGYIAAHGLSPDFAVVSPARRTVQTWELMAAAFASPCPPKYEPRLYDASEEALLAAVQAIPAARPTAMLVGHNPGFERLAALLAGRGARRDLDRMHEKFPTCALAVIDFDIDRWKDAAPTKGTLISFVTPASLPGQ
jgi:phosphohistidine phosphatase